MSYPKVGTYRRSVTKIRKAHKITPLDFDILIFMSENDITSKYDVWKNVSNSKGSVQTSLKYLESKGLIKNVRPHRTGRRGFPGGYAITGKARSIITEFYMTLFPEL